MTTTTGWVKMEPTGSRPSLRASNRSGRGGGARRGVLRGEPAERARICHWTEW